MKIAIVHSFYSQSAPSGENSAVNAQAELLESAGHEVLLISRYTDKEAGRPGYKISAAIAAAGIAGPDPTDEIRTFRPDVVHIHNLFPNWGAGWLRKWGGPKVATIHNFRTLCSSGLLFRDGESCTECLDHSSVRALKHRCYRESAVATLPLAWASRSKGARQPLLHSVDRLILLNEFARSIYAPLTPVPLAVVPNFSLQTATPQENRSGFLYVGRLSSEKGAVELAQRFPDWSHLRVIGDGPQVETIKDIARASRGSVEYAGRLSHEETMRAVASAEGLIVPSLCTEGIPSVALEAMAHGTPIIVSDRCVSAGELTAYGNGEIYRPLDSDHLAQKVKSILEDSQKYRQASLSAYIDRYSPGRWLNEITQLYSGVLNVH